VAVSIYSLHDFFWWIIFNLRYSHCALRGPLFYYSGTEIREAIADYLINWYKTSDYQLWSMGNNNNGQKYVQAGCDALQIGGEKLHLRFRPRRVVLQIQDQADPAARPAAEQFRRVQDDVRPGLRL
jgi:hypothetical protein